MRLRSRTELPTLPRKPEGDERRWQTLSFVLMDLLPRISSSRIYLPENPAPGQVCACLAGKLAATGMTLEIRRLEPLTSALRGFYRSFPFLTIAYTQGAVIFGHVLAT